jgi:hypothetical protein
MSKWLEWQPKDRLQQAAPETELNPATQEFSNSPESKPTKPTKPDSDLATHESALAFVNRAAARLVVACPSCYPDAPEAAEYLVLVPPVSDGPDFRRALATLKIPYPVVYRRDPLSHLPPRCQHVGEVRA